MEFIQNNNISRYNYNNKYNVKVCFMKVNKINDKLYKYYNYDNLNDIHNYLLNNNYDYIDEDVIITNFNNIYKYDNNENETYTKEENILSEYDDNIIMYTKIYTNVMFNEMPNCNLETKKYHIKKYIKEIKLEDKTFLDNKLIINPFITIINIDNRIEIQIDIGNNKENFDFKCLNNEIDKILIFLKINIKNNLEDYVNKIQNKYLHL